MFYVLHGCTKDSRFVFIASMRVNLIKPRHHIFKGQFTELHEFAKPTGLFSSTISSYKKREMPKNMVRTWLKSFVLSVVSFLTFLLLFHANFVTYHLETLISSG